MVNFMKFIKNNLLIIIAFIVFILLEIIYVNRSLINVLYLDGLMQVPNIEKYYNGTLNISDISHQWGEHRLIGYSLIFLLNAIFFGLNTRLEQFLFVLCYFLIGLVLYIKYKEFLKNVFKRNFKKWMEISYVPILFLIFGLTHPPGMLMTTQFVIGTLFFILLIGFFDRICLDSKKWADLIWFVTLFSVYLIFFSGANFLGALLGFIVCFLFKILFSNKKKPSFSCLISIVLVLFLVIVYLSLNKFDQDGVGLLQKIILFTSYFKESFLSLLAGISATTLDIHTFQEVLGGRDVFVLINGSILFLTGIYSIYKYIFLKMYKLTYLPLLLMFYSVGLILSTRLGRLNGGWLWPMNEWYAFHLYFYLIGILWILFYDVLRKYIQSPIKRFRFIFGENRWSLTVFVFTIVWIFSFQIFSNLAQWRRGPYIKQWLEPKKVALLYPTDENLEDLLWTKEDSLKAIDILKKYKLNVFKENNSSNFVKLYGWNNDGWINKSARATIKSGLEGVILVNISLPRETFIKIYKNSLMLQFLVDGKTVKKQYLSSDSFDNGSIDVIFDVPKNQELNLEIKLDKSFIPKDSGLGKDSRELGIIVNKLEVK